MTLLKLGARMTRFSLNYLTLSSPKPLKFTKANFLKKSAVVAGCFWLTGCSSPTLHSDLKPDPHVLQRKWTLSTHGPFQAGDHGYEYSNPLIIENTLVFGNRSVGLVSLYPGINQQRWALPIPGGVI